MYQISGNRSHKAPLVVQATSGAQRLHQIVRGITPYQDARVPFGA
jgi:hypothetical protein